MISLEKDLVIFWEDWVATIQGWIKIELDPTRAPRLGHSCGFCHALARSGINRSATVNGCKPCPAYPEMCTGHKKSKSVYIKVCNAFHRGKWKTVEKEALKILQWLQEFGAIADWHHTDLDDFLDKSRISKT